jgi:high-affinity iron transporter
VVAAPAPAAAQGTRSSTVAGAGPSAAEVAERAGRVASLLELAAGEYALGVPAEGGRVSAPPEYAEARQFVAQATDLFAGLPAASRRSGAEAMAAGPRLDSLRRAVERRSPPADVRELAARTARSLASGWGAVLVPSPPYRPSAARGAALYRADCAACHGSSGEGDGPAAAGIEPPPADLTAAARAIDGTPARDFQVLTLGVPGTRMQGRGDELSVQERWDLVAYIQTLRFGASQVAEGAALALGDDADSATSASPVSGRLRAWSALPAAARLSDRDLRGRVQERWLSATGDTLSSPQARAVVAYARDLLGTPASGVPAAGPGSELGERIERADSLAGVAARLGRSGNAAGARAAALDAYMAFEGAETGLRSRAPGLTGRIEAAFGSFRDEVSSSEPGAGAARRIAASRADLHDLLARAGDAVRSPVTAWSLATQSFFVILREGFEAILIIGAILTFLARTGHERRRRDVHLGVGAAVLASFLTAWGLQEVLSVTPASQDVLEGATMLVAVAVLFSVSYWLLSKMESDRWQAYLHGRMRRALGAGGGMALAGVAFLAVYREGFETVLFYKALFGFSTGSAVPVAGGFVAGCVALAVLYLAFNRFGVRIPMRPFFGVTPEAHRRGPGAGGGGAGAPQSLNITWVSYASMRWERPSIPRRRWDPSPSTTGMKSRSLTPIFRIASSSVSSGDTVSMSSSMRSAARRSPPMSSWATARASSG